MKRAMPCLLWALVLLVVLVPSLAIGDAACDLNTQLMLSTFKLSHPDSSGTAVVMTRPSPKDPKGLQYVLVTAEHALSRIKADEATLQLRKKDGEGRYAKSPLKIKIRQGGKPLWTRHPTADVAAMIVALPPEAAVPGVPADRLASDRELQQYDIHPGDLIRGIGFPFPNQFDANEGGFPVIRTGCIASYPLLPTRQTKTFFLDCNTFEGDSGAPVYLSEANRFYAGSSHEGRVELVLGLISGQQFLNEEIKSIYLTEKLRHRMGLGIVVHAAAIRETLDLLPPGPEGIRQKDMGQKNEGK